jgi:hypothetical protein
MYLLLFFFIIRICGQRNYRLWGIRGLGQQFQNRLPASKELYAISCTVFSWYNAFFIFTLYLKFCFNDFITDKLGKDIILRPEFVPVMVQLITSKYNQDEYVPLSSSSSSSLISHHLRL